MHFNELVPRCYEPQPVVWKGKYVDNWFSNFHSGQHPIRLEGLEFSNIEAAYQASKWTDPGRRRAFVRLDASAAKREGQRRFPPMRQDWDEVNVAAMDFFLRQKFAVGTPELERLMASDRPIVEVNNWKDRRWGVEMDWQGRNALGLLLSLIRWEYRTTGQVLPGVPEAGWSERQAELIPLMNRIGPPSSRLGSALPDPAPPAQPRLF